MSMLPTFRNLTLLCVASFVLPQTLSAQWQKKANMISARGEHASAVIDGKIYVLTGFARKHDKKYYGEIYDPVTNTWAYKSNASGATFAL